MSSLEKWPSVKLGDICNVVTGGTPPKSTATYYGGNIPWIKPDNLDKEMYVTQSAEYLSLAGAENSRLLPVGSVLVSCIGNLGKVAIAGVPLATNQQINSLIPSGRVDSEYLYYACSAKRNELARLAAITIIPIVNKSAFSGLEIPLPQIEQQRQIAARLKAQLTEVETARHAAQVQLRDAALLRQRLLRQTFDTLADGPIVMLRDVADLAAGITLGRKTSETKLVDVPYMRVANVKDGVLDTSDMKTVAATAREIEKWTLRDGDLLLTEGGDLDKLGRGACWRNQLPLCIHQNHIFRVRLPADRYEPDFVSFQVSSPYGKAYFFAHAKKTTGIASINQGVLGAFPLLSPSLGDQRRIVAHLKQQLAEVDALRAALEQQLRDLDALPQRILAQAFNREQPTE